jgi:hypothetical protein
MIAGVLVVLILGFGAIALLDRMGLTSIFDSNSTIRVERSGIDTGRLIQGNKISIRDQIRVEKTASYAIDGPLWPLGNERKNVSLSFLAELGYFPKDILHSEKVDTFEGNLLRNRTLLIDLPLPDTLSFVSVRTELRDQEWFWEGWIESGQVRDMRARFIDSLRVAAYADFRQQFLHDRQLNTLEEATRTLLNYVNAAYRIGNDVGFSTVIASYRFVQEGKQHWVRIRCQEYGDCEISRSVTELEQKL